MSKSKPLDLFEIARDMLITLEGFDESFCILHEGEDVTEVALFLDKAIENSLIVELHDSPEGLLILIGITTATYGCLEQIKNQNEDLINEIEDREIFERGQTKKTNTVH